jgi:acetyl-CoA C-acetyltransferase
MAQFNEVCIVSYARTPMGSLAGSLSSFSAAQLGACAMKAVLSNASVGAEAVEEVFFGHVLTGGAGQHSARQAAEQAGIRAPATGVNKVCASGMKAATLGAQAVMLGLRDCVMVGGMESMSNAPYVASAMRGGARMGHTSMEDSMIKDGLWDACGADHGPAGAHMGVLAELCAAAHGIDRAAQDAHAAESYRRAAAAARAGKFAEIVTVEVAGKRGKPPTLVVADEEVALRGESTSAASLGAMRTAFARGAEATVTAGNASTISDGAAALLLMSRAKAAELGVAVLATISGFGEGAKKPEEFTTAPALAIPHALARAGVALGDVDFFEINEAFSVVACANLKLLQLDDAKVNVYGGAVAMGHPLGCSGARIMCTLLSVLRQEGGATGCAAVCNGGGGASAVVIKLEPSQ